MLREAAGLTDNASLKNFLNLRADAFLSNDYYASDLAWMDLDAPIDITIGPYETYNDESSATKRPSKLTSTCATMKRPKSLRSQRAPAGDREQSADRSAVPQSQAGRGGADPRGERDSVLRRRQPRRGDRRLQSAQRRARGQPEGQQAGHAQEHAGGQVPQRADADRAPDAARAGPEDLSFESFFTHILAHELMHGLGPHQIKVDGRDTTPRAELKELYSAIEEAKADVTGLFALQYMMDQPRR